MKANRLTLLAVAGTSLLALTGCTQTGNVAARVGDTTVTTADVDFLARVQCATLDKAAQDPSQAQAGAQTVALSQVRTGVVNTLVDAELNRQLAAREHLTYDTATLNSVMEQYAPLFALAPAKDRERFRDEIRDVFVGQLQIYGLAQHNLAGQGITKPTQDQGQQEVARIQAEFRKTVHVEVNPVYGADAEGVAGSVDPSLSKAVSSFAKQASSAQPDASWVTGLPVGQKCG